MTQRYFVKALSFACAVLFSTSSWAAATATVNPSSGATVNPSSGVVLINRGKGYNQIKKPVKLSVGNSVMVGPDGAAVIAYKDGCTVNVAPGTVETVARLSPCTSGSSAANEPNYQNNYCYENPSACVVTAAVATLFGVAIYEFVSP
jgi:hypothetical protein